MTRLLRLSPLAPAILLSLALAACGGSEGSDQPVLTPEPAMATAGFERFNENRELMGLALVARSPAIDTAAQGHSKYQARNNVITHDQTSGKPDFTGVHLLDRLTLAQYQFNPDKNYAYGEVIAKTGYTDGVAAADALITAIYHRFVIFEPMYKEAGAGATSAESGYTYFTTDFAVNNGLVDGLGVGNFTVYPADGQKNLPNNFFSDSEEPDPVPSQNEVGYPISVHADVIRKVTVTAPNFTVRRRGGALLPVQLLTSTSDTNTPSSAAAIIPLAPLAAGTTYDVDFSGSICTISPPDTTCTSANTAIARSWSFTTK